MLARAIRVLIRHPKLTCVLVAASLAISALGAARIRFHFQYSDFYDYPSNPQMPAFRRYLNDFADGGTVVVLLTSDDVFRSDNLRYIDALTRAFEHDPHFARVRSLSNVNLVRATDDGVETGPLLGHMPSSPTELASLRHAVESSSLVLRRLVSRDGTLSAILLGLPQHGGLASIDEQRAALASAGAILSTIPKPARLTAAISGGPSVEVETTDTIIRDQLVLTPAVLLLIALALLATFRSLQGMLLPLAAVNVSVLWTLGVFGFAIGKADLTASIIPTVLLSYGVVDPVFVLARYYRHYAAGASREDAIVTTLEQLLLPCFLTSLSTALGFAAFATATLPTIRNFGLIVGLGILLAFVTTVIVLPALLMLLPTPARAGAPNATPAALDTLNAAGPVDGFLRWLFRATQPRRLLVLAGALGFAALGALAYHRTPVNNVYVGLLADGPTTRNVALLDRKLSGVMPHAVYLEGPTDAMKRPEVVRAIAEIDAFAERDPRVGSVTSLADLIGDLHRAFNAGDPALTPLPESATLISQYLSLVDPKDRADFVSDDLSRSHITIRAQDPGSRAALRFIAELKRVIAAQHFERYGVHATITGSVLPYRELDRLVSEVVWGFVIAFTIIVLLQWILFRSARIALASILPNLLPVAAAFMCMRVLNLQLRMDNALVLCVCVGGLFNTTIHLVARMLQQLRAGQPAGDPLIEQALRTVGPPSLYTALVLSLGFSVLLLSKFPGMRDFGVLCAVTLITGFFADAVVTSVLMHWLLGVGKSLVSAKASVATPDSTRLEQSGGQI